MESNGLKHYPALYAWAILCFVPTLFYFYVGEEGVYTISSLEMWQHQEFMNTVMYGAPGFGGGRPPFFNWLMIPVANLIGWEHVLVASRMVTVAATIGTSLTVGWLAQQLWKNRTVSWTAALLYLTTADVLLYRGWLSYADPLFAMFIVQAIALVWVACIRRSHWMLLVAMVLAFAAFLTKAFTVYVFLGAAMLVLLTNVGYRRFILSFRAWIIYAFALFLLLAWRHLSSLGSFNETMMINDILRKLVMPDIGGYLVRLVSFPAEMFMRLMPASFIIGYLLWKQREKTWGDPAVRIALLIALLNFLPYLLSPEGLVRYVLPVYAFVVLAAAYLVVQLPNPFRLKRWIVGMLIAGTIMNTFLFPYYQKKYRGENYVTMAQEILNRYGQYPLYVANVSSIGLAVAANIDVMRLDQPALQWPPEDFTDGIVIAHAAEDVTGKVLGEVRSHGDSVLLICRGAACDAR